MINGKIARKSTTSTEGMMNTLLAVRSAREVTRRNWLACGTATGSLGGS